MLRRAGSLGRGGAGLGGAGWGGHAEWGHLRRFFGTSSHLSPSPSGLVFLVSPPGSRPPPPPPPPFSLPGGPEHLPALSPCFHSLHSVPHWGTLPCTDAPYKLGPVTLVPHAWLPSWTHVPNWFRDPTTLPSFPFLSFCFRTVKFSGVGTGGERRPIENLKQTLGQAQTLPYVPGLWGYTGLLFFPSGSLHSHCPADSPTPTSPQPGLGQPPRASSTVP